MSNKKWGGWCGGGVPEALVVAVVQALVRGEGSSFGKNFSMGRRVRIQQKNQYGLVLRACRPTAGGRKTTCPGVSFFSK